MWRPFWKWRPVDIFQCRESIWDIIIYPYIKFWWYRTMLIFCGIVAVILKMATGRKFSMSVIIFRTSLSTHISNFDDIGQCWIFTALFYAVFWQPFWKWQPSWKFWKYRIAPLMVTYHYVKFYVSYHYPFRSYQH